jgi:prepilin-type processing-associated H-X9-DG protein
MHMKKSDNYGAQAFVVFGIIAVLSGILFPVFKSIREKSDQNQCSYNEKRIAMAMFQYANDYDQTYAPGVAKGATFDTLLLPFTSEEGFGSKTDSRVFRCPDDTFPRFRNRDARSYGLVGGAQGFLRTVTKPYGYTKPRHLSDLENPAATFMATERPARNMYIGSAVVSVDSPQDQLNVPGKTSHSGGWNYTYADGHVQWLRPTQTVGRGVDGSGRAADGIPCTLSHPCGPWTIDPSD